MHTITQHPGADLKSVRVSTIRRQKHTQRVQPDCGNVRVCSHDERRWRTVRRRAVAGGCTRRTWRAEAARWLWVSDGREEWRGVPRVVVGRVWGGGYWSTRMAHRSAWQRWWRRRRRRRRRGAARRGAVRRGMARHDTATARRGEARRGEARRGEARRSEVRLGTAWRGAAEGIGRKARLPAHARPCLRLRAVVSYSHPSLSFSLSLSLMHACGRVLVARHVVPPSLSGPFYCLATVKRRRSRNRFGYQWIFFSTLSVSVSRFRFLSIYLFLCPVASFF